MSNYFHLFESKMQSAGLSDAAIKAFKCSYDALISGDTGIIKENDIEPVTDIPSLEKNIMGTVKVDSNLLKKTVVLKLNGGLGTSMGLDKAKSLLSIKDNDTFLDLIAKQIMHLRKKYNCNIRFLLMNSFSTSEDTLSYLKLNYPLLMKDKSNDIELLQNKVPKVDINTMKPVEWNVNTSKEWCPPGHGDLYPALLGSGKLEKLINEGYEYMFVSNSDNLGATLDLELLTYFAQSNKTFLMECCERTENDKKGGHLAYSINNNIKKLILRESAQCASEDEMQFQNIKKHQFFNTNSLWINLPLLLKEIKNNNGFLKLPMIKNKKTVDPKISTSISVYQLETAMGAAIECFADKAGAVVVPRTRFAPVKKCDDLLLLRSDAYKINDDFIPVLNNNNKVSPIINLDPKAFKLVQQLEYSTKGMHQVPSLKDCKSLNINTNNNKLTFSKNIIFRGDVTIVNTSNNNEEKILPNGIYENIKIDLADNKYNLGNELSITNMTTEPISGQKPGTSGLRKKTSVFMNTKNYLQNFIQSTFDALPINQVMNGILVIGGDGRYYNKEAIQLIIKMAIANGVSRILVGQNGLLSTPAVSAVIREHKIDSTNQKIFGGFILTASHNPGGIHEDFGIKYNTTNGGPANEQLTNQIYQNTLTITSYNICNQFPTIDTSILKKYTFASKDEQKSREIIIDIIHSTEDHINLLKNQIFDFDFIKKTLFDSDNHNTSKFKFIYDCMSGVQGPYAHDLFIKLFQCEENVLLNAIPKEDFDGKHADPNLTYAKELIKIMGIDNRGQPVNNKVNSNTIPDFGAACDGDADRNMILGKQFFVTPSDSLAIIADYACEAIPYFKKNGLKAVARSMPTSSALDFVIKKKNETTNINNPIKLFQVPTGWKFFGNIMDSHLLNHSSDSTPINYNPFLCGEESFGTGSNHIREKDGLWSVLAWLSILAYHKHNNNNKIVSVKNIVQKHWRTYGRNYYCRYDYEDCDAVAANQMMSYMNGQASIFLLNNKISILFNKKNEIYKLISITNFSYHDTIDHSISSNQGIIYLFEDGSRIIFRLSGTGVNGATIRMYIEKYQKSNHTINNKKDICDMNNTNENIDPLLVLTPEVALKDLIEIALEISKLKEFTKRNEPSVIT